MADGSAHFKAAASNIRQGIQAKNSEIAELRHKAEMVVHDTKKHVEGVKQKLTALQVLVAEGERSQGSNVNNSDTIRNIKELHEEISGKEREAEREREQINSEIKDLERDAAGLEQLAKNVESKA